MEEDGKKYPSLPSNYVTLAQLQERWLKDQRRKQIEKEEEEKRKQRELKEEEERKRCERELEERKSEVRENRNRWNKSREGSKAKNNFYRHRPFEKNRPIQTKKSYRAIGVSERKSEESQVGAIVAGNGERKIDGLKMKKKGNSKKKKGKPTAEDDLTGRTERSLPAYAEVEKKIPVVLTERDGEKEGVTSGFRRKGKNSVVEVMIPEKKKVPEDRSTEIGGKFEDLSLSGGKGCNERSARNMRGGQWTSSRSSEWVNRRSLWKPRDSNFVWVRKGDTSDVNAAEVCNSGVLGKARGNWYQ